MINVWRRINCQSLWSGHTGARGTDRPMTMIMPGIYCPWPLTQSWKTACSSHPQSCVLEPSVQPCNLHPIIKFWAVSMFSSESGHSIQPTVPMRSKITICGTLGSVTARMVIDLPICIVFSSTINCCPS